VPFTFSPWRPKQSYASSAVIAAFVRRMNFDMCCATDSAIAGGSTASTQFSKRASCMNASTRPFAEFRLLGCARVIVSSRRSLDSWPCRNALHSSPVTAMTDRCFSGWRVVLSMAASWYHPPVHPPVDPFTEKDVETARDESRRDAPRPAEVGGRKGPDPTRYGDWEKNGRCIDF
jgi:hypothetical protein